MKRILVVDDNDDLLEMFTQIFTINKYEVKTTSLKKDIIPLILRFQPHLILIDIMLSGADGREICRDIKETHKHIPIILISANANLLENYTDCNADDVIEKPFDLKELLEKVNRFCSVS
jgi:DNA-binding response OmpR family regulator